jgi:hypothetical protein
MKKITKISYLESLLFWRLFFLRSARDLTFSLPEWCSRVKIDRLVLILLSSLSRLLPRLLRSKGVRWMVAILFTGNSWLTAGWWPYSLQVTRGSQLEAAAHWQRDWLTARSNCSLSGARAWLTVRNSRSLPIESASSHELILYHMKPDLYPIFSNSFSNSQRYFKRIWISSMWDSLIPILVAANSSRYYIFIIYIFSMSAITHIK